MRSNIAGFTLGVVLTWVALGIIYRAWHPPSQPGMAIPGTPVVYSIPRCDDLVPTGAIEDWVRRGFRINVLQPISNFPSEQDVIPSRAFVAWNKDAFFVRVEVDTFQTIEAEKDDKLWLGDSVEFFFSKGPDISWGCQVIVAPGLDPQHPAKRELIWKAPQGSPKPFPVKTLSHPTQNGYAIEFFLPWSAFNLVPQAGQPCAMQIIVNHRDGGIMRHMAWFPGVETGWRPEQSMLTALAENGSPAINSLAQATALTPRMGRAFYMLGGPEEHGHTLSIRYKDQILFRHEADGSDFSYEAFFPFPEKWDDAEPVEVYDNEEVLASLTKDKSLSQIQSLADGLSYRFFPSVFGENQFPSAGFEQDGLVRRFFSPVKITTTFYDANYHKVIEAGKPGRYGAVVQIRLNGSEEVHKFITLYRIPNKADGTSGKIDWRVTPLPITAQFPSELGLNSAVVRAQQNEIGTAIKNNYTASINANSDAAILFAGLSETPPDAPPVVARTNAWARDADWWYGLRQKLGLGESYSYLADLPAGYGNDPNKRWPLILFLHGLGDGSHVRYNGLAKLMGEGKQLPAVVISPECPGWWQSKLLSDVLDEVCAKYRIDPDRIYVTGLSMGGFGTWSLALAYPDRFAAIVPIAGGGDPPDAARLCKLPIWAFHGDVDEIVPVSMTTDMVEALRKDGGHPHMTIYPGVNHAGSWPRAYDTEALYTWLFAQKRGQPEVKTPGIPTP